MTRPACDARAHCDVIYRFISFSNAIHEAIHEAGGPSSSGERVTGYLKTILQNVALGDMPLNAQIDLPRAAPAGPVNSQNPARDRRLYN